VRWVPTFVINLIMFANCRMQNFAITRLPCVVSTAVDHRRAFRTRGLGKKFGLEGYECCLISAYDNAVDIRLNVAKAISLKP